MKEQMVKSLLEITPKILQDTKEALYIIQELTKDIPELPAYPKNPNYNEGYNNAILLWEKNYNRPRQSKIEVCEKDILNKLSEFQGFIVTSVGIIYLEQHEGSLQIPEQDERIYRLYKGDAVVLLYQNILKIYLDDGYYGSPEYPIFWERKPINSSRNS